MNIVEALVIAAIGLGVIGFLLLITRPIERESKGLHPHKDD
jgi:hypothetical protein